MSKFANLSPEQQSIARNLKSDFASNDAVRTKNASLATTDYLRIRLREDSVFRQIITPKPVNESDLDRRVETDLPCTIMDIEAKSAGAVTIPFGDIPPSNIIKANRFMVTYNKVASQRYQIDTVRLMTWNMDIRDMFYDLMLKDIMDEEDTKFFTVVNNIIGTTKGTYFADTGAKRWMDCGPFGRDSLTHFKKALPSNNCNLMPGIFLVNAVTANDFIAMDRSEAGGDIAQEMLFGTASIDKVMGTKLVVTTKKNLVPTNNVFQFAPEEYLGVFYVLKDVTMVTDLKEDEQLNFSAYEYVGGTIENTAALARGTFEGSAPTSKWEDQN